MHKGGMLFSIDWLFATVITVHLQVARFRAKNKTPHLSGRVLVAVAACLLATSHFTSKANAQCAPVWTSPGTWQSTQANPPVVTGTITLSWLANCQPNTNYNQVGIAAGCPDSVNPSCMDWTNPFTTYPNDYYYEVFNIPTNATSIQFDTLPFSINEEYDVNIRLLNDGIGLGTADTDCPANQYGRQDCDLLIQVNNSASATSCSPVITAPTENAVLSGTATVGATANCNATYNHLLWSFGAAGGTTQTGFVNIPSSSTTGTLNTTQFPSGYYQVSAAAYPTSDTNAIVPKWSPLRYFSIQNDFASATSCSPVITAPIDNAVLAGTATVGAAANCNGAYNHLLWSFGPAGGTAPTGFVIIPSGSTTGTLYTAQFPNGNYQVSAAAYLTSDANAIVSGWSPPSYFSIHH